MKTTSFFLIIAFVTSLFTQQIVSYSIDDGEGSVYLMTLNVCEGSQDTFSQDTNTPCVSERVFLREPHTRVSWYLMPSSVQYDSLPAAEKDHPPRFTA
jgi:hypothetical protein